MLDIYTSINASKVVIYMQKLHHFCYTHTYDDGQKLGRKF